MHHGSRAIAWVGDRARAWRLEWAGERWGYVARLPAPYATQYRCNPTERPRGGRQTCVTQVIVTPPQSESAVHDAAESRPFTGPS